MERNARPAEQIRRVERLGRVGAKFVQAQLLVTPCYLGVE